MNKIDKQYQDLLKSILEYGVEKKDRTGTGTKSIFGYTIRHNMRDGFPLITTKKMAWKTMVTELLWFLKGDTNIRYLIDNDCHIWDGDAYKSYEKKVKQSIDQATAERILKSPLSTTLSGSTAVNDINAMLNMGMIPEGYRVNHFLTDTDAFFIMTDAPNGLKEFVRAPIKTAIEGDFDTGNVRFKARERYSFGWSDPRGIFGSAGAA